jgi:uncharacterized coiled-coil protein SlyX
MAKPSKPKPKPEDTPEQRIADLERELKFRDERISELKTELDEQRELVNSMEEHVKERDEYLETFISTFGLVLDDDGKWTNGEAIKERIASIDKHIEMIDRYNKLVGRFNRNIANVNPVGRPIAASEAQQAEIIKHHRRGKSARWIAEEMTLSRRTVTTIIGKLDGSDRTTNLRRQRLGLEPKRKDWRPAAMARLPRQATKHLEKGRELLKEAKGLK